MIATFFKRPDGSNKFEPILYLFVQGDFKMFLDDKCIYCINSTFLLSQLIDFRQV